MKGFISKCLSAHNSNTLMITIIVSLNSIGSCVSFALEQPTPQTKFQNFIIFSLCNITHVHTAHTHNGVFIAKQKQDEYMYVNINVIMLERSEKPNLISRLLHYVTNKQINP